MLKNNALIDYLVQFHATRDYFECHEILEEYWKSEPKDDYSELWVALIQVAVAQYHDRRDNNIGAKRMYESAIKKLKSYTHCITEIDIQHLIDDINSRLEQLNNPFIDINIVILSDELKSACLNVAEEYQLKWGISSADVSPSIIDKHKLRDRTEVIKEREQALRKRSKKES